MNIGLKALFAAFFILSVSATSHAMNLGRPIDAAAFPIHYKIDGKIYDSTRGVKVDTTEGIVAEIRHAFNTWQSVDGAAISFIYDGLYDSAAANTQGPGTILVYLTSDNFPQTSGAPAGSGGQSVDQNGRVTGGVVMINTKANNFFHNEEGYLYRVVLHELGHVLGLNHTPVSGATMSYAREELQLFLSLDDQDAVRSLYPSDNLRGGTINVRALFRQNPAKEVELALIDTITGVGRFNVTNADGAALFSHIPAGRYILAGREIVPTGPCFSQDRTRGFLTTFYNGAQGTNNPESATIIDVNDQTNASVNLNLVAGMKRYDCYYGMKIWTTAAPSEGHHVLQNSAAQYLAEPGEEFNLLIIKDQNPMIPDWHRTQTSGGVVAGTELIPAGTVAGYTIDVIDTANPDEYVSMESRGSIYATVGVDDDAAFGPQVVYCKNNGETALTAVSFYIVNEVAQNPFETLRAPGP